MKLKLFLQCESAEVLFKNVVARVFMLSCVQTSSRRNVSAPTKSGIDLDQLGESADSDDSGAEFKMNVDEAFAEGWYNQCLYLALAR